jgi:ERCC4 domain
MSGRTRWSRYAFEHHRKDRASPVDLPATARVFCHRYEELWPEDAEIVDEAPVLVCRRRGPAVDLVLDRPRQARSQFVFTQVKGRETIFWQTQKTARAANPGGRVPRARVLAEPVTITVDTRERYPYRFTQQGAITERATVAAGDYAIHAADGRLLAAVERKSLDNLAATLSDGSLAFQLQRLAELPLAAVVVEARYSALFKLEHVNGTWLAEPAHPTPSPLPRHPDPLRRHTPPRRRPDPPLPHHRAHRHRRNGLTAGR